ncbi:failed axon connections homolog [Ruditapes philippinarum]|uniref:failed axon connections homolog n=1 Tax=Ruditapes philippinarum TaxID=129788 RepID=UPI00295B9236|nr:failed axon connections homolog [Ruditapes philippinarum]
MLIERLCDLCKRHTAIIALGLPAITVTTGLLIKRFRRVYTRTNRICGIDYPRDVVILHPLGRGITGPDTSHFVVKLETYLRFHNILYQSDFNIDNYKLGPKQKVPWIEYNDVTLGDSQMIIEFLNKELNVDMDAHLSKQEKALAWAIQKWIEEFMYWISVQWTWVLFIEETFQDGISPFPLDEKSAVKDWVANMTYTAGIGRHSEEEILEMTVSNLRKFSDILGERQYIFGDKMSTVDCSAFGIFSQMRWLTPKSCPCYKVFEDGEISNVVKYLDRIRDHYWPDWDNPRF